MIYHQLTIIVKIVIHANFKEGQQAKIDFTHDLPAALIHDFLNLSEVLINRLPVLQLKGRKVNVILSVEEIIQSGIYFNLIIITAQSVRSAERLEAKGDGHH